MENLGVVEPGSIFLREAIEEEHLQRCYFLLVQVFSVDLVLEEARHVLHQIAKAFWF